MFKNTTNTNIKIELPTLQSPVMRLLLITVFVVALAHATIIRIPLEKRNGVRVNYVTSTVITNQTNAIHQPNIYLSTNYRNDYYTTNVSLGTPAQTFNLAVFSGSPSFWVLDQSYAMEHERAFGFDMNSSTTAELQEGPEFFDDFAAGIAKGETFVDTFRIGDLVVKNQTFGSILSIEEETHTFGADGVLGLSWSFEEADANKSEMPILKIFEQLENKMFTMWLGPDLKPSQGSSIGQLTLGGFDSDHCASDVHYVPATKSAYWISTFQIDKVKVGEFSIDKSAVAMLDSGSPVLQAQDESHAQFYRKQVNAIFDEHHHMFTVNCDDVPKLPILEFTIAGKVFALQPKDYIVEFELTDNRCGVAVGHESTLNFGYILGTPFLRSYCVVYDYAQRRYGFAAKKP
ncbi:Aspartic protease 17 [Aphelenchoides besseyi]|nr:Aspartic protease 17 [Aphelenchoides besseyi]KAI6231468.1 Aspartic protease 17 [Aphelenchoides besseyi]